MPPSWVPLIQSIINGEPIDASTTNRPIRQLAERTEYLKALLTMTGIGKGSFDLDAPCSEDVFEGCAVYWNGNDKQYQPALASLESGAGGTFSSYADSSFVAGVCIGKTTSVRGIIGLSGRVDEVDFSAAIGGEVTPGPYYLSSTVPGHMTHDKPSVGVLVMFGYESQNPTSGSAILFPTFRHLVEDHVHYAVELSNATGVSADDKGWVAAGNAIFGGLAPVGAVYGYNIDKDTSLSPLFPFTPVDTVYYELDGTGSQGAIITDNNGIWWVDGGTDPDAYALVKVYFVKMVSKTADNTVTSLQPGADQPIKFVNCQGHEASTGNLFARLALNFSQTDLDTPGWNVLKELTGTNQFKRGPVVESIVSNTLDISFRTVDGQPQGSTLEHGGRVGQLILNYTPTELGREGSSSLVALYNAREESFETGTEEIPYIALPQSSFSRVSYRFNIPSIGLASPTYTMTFWAWVLATIGTAPGGTDLPELLCQFKVISNATGLVKPTLTTGFSSVTPLIYAPDGGGMVANQYVRGYITGITVAPGDQVYVLINRNLHGSDGYGGDVGILRTGYSILV